MPFAQYCLSEKPRVLPFEPDKTCVQTYPITEYQPIYFLTDSFDDAKSKLKCAPVLCTVLFRSLC